MTKDKLRPFQVSVNLVTTKQSGDTTLEIRETVSGTRLAKNKDRALQAQVLWSTKTFYVPGCTSFTVELTGVKELSQEHLGELLHYARPFEDIVAEESEDA